MRMVYDELVNDSGFDPTRPGPELPPWEPWTMQGALDMLNERGHSERTEPTAENPGPHWHQILTLGGEEEGTGTPQS